MIATISAQPIRMSHRQQYANSAAGPLPIIPRRASSIRQSAAPLAPMSKRITDVAGGSPTIQRSSSSSSESDGGSTYSAPLTIRARRAKAAQAQGHLPAELANAIAPLSRSHMEADGKPGSLRASKTEDNITLAAHKASAHQYLYSPGMSLRFGSESRASSNKPPCAPSDDSRLIRKKSGQLVKPSLKTSRSANGAEGLSMFSSSKSEPATPVCKAVHFDSQLEHIKLFLAEQKPLAVSRDGSPTDDTSGTDSDFPSFIFGNENDKRDRMKLIIHVVNMPPRMNMSANVCLEEVSVSSGNNAILGRVRVRNIAYVKTVAVRFTFDSWQTTSEVIGHYFDSTCNNYDRFSFTIKLDDLLARIDDKTLVLAVRYSVAGHEYWDNNYGGDYIAKFSRSAPRDRSLSDDESSENLVSLQTKLEKVVEGKDRTGPAFSLSSTRPLPESEAFKSPSSLAARYDFNASFKNPWKYQGPPPLESHQRNNSFPQSARPDRPVLKVLPVLGSPRDLTGGDIVDSPAKAQIDGLPFQSSDEQQHVRNHHRGYFDLSTFGAANVRRTPPTSPPSRSPEIPSPVSGTVSQFGRYYSFPPLDASKADSPDILHRPPPLVSGLFSDMGFESELSTPSLTTPTSSRSTTPSPTEKFLTLPDEESPLHPDPHYRELINQYCFFTGGGQEISPIDFGSLKSLRATQILATDITPKALPQARMGSLSPLSSPMSSSDDLASMRSGSITPTASRLNLNESRSPTPTPCAS